MEFLLVFSVSLIIAVLISDLASRSVLSTAVLFLFVGFISSHSLTGWIQLDAHSPAVEKFFEVALFTVLFTDGMRISMRDLRQEWSVSSRALLVGMPLTMAATAALCHWFVRLPWTESMLVGAALSPTDPIFAAAIVGREEVSIRVRRLLNVESGFNDGLALPAVMILLGQLGGQSVGYGESAGSLGAGIAIGVAVPFLVITALDSRYFAAAGGVYKRLGAIGIGLLVFALTSMTHANEFLAAFVAGITIGIRGPTIKRSFFVIGETAAELVKLGAVLIFGSLLSVEFFASMPLGAYVFAVLVLFVVRPIALAPALAGTDLTRQERMTIVWFGPKGFSSLLFGFLVLSTKTVHAMMMFGLIGLVVVASILAHSSTDTLVAHSFRDSMLRRKNAA